MWTEKKTVDADKGTECELERSNIYLRIINGSLKCCDCGSNTKCPFIRQLV